MVLTFFMCGDTVAETVDDCNLFFHIFKGDAEKRRELLRDRVPAGDAEIRFHIFLFDESVSVAVTSSKAAGAAVGPGKTLPYFWKTFVLLHCHEF